MNGLAQWEECHLTGKQDYHQNEPLNTMNSPLDEIQIGQFIIIWSRLFPRLANETTILSVYWTAFTLLRTRSTFIEYSCYHSSSENIVLFEFISCIERNTWHTCDRIRALLRFSIFRTPFKYKYVKATKKKKSQLKIANDIIVKNYNIARAHA